MANTVEIIVHASDAASGILRGISSQFGSMGGLVDQLTAKNINWGNVAQSATTMVIDGAKQVIKYIQDSIKMYDEYTTSIVDQARVLGLDVEETSKLVQASDDLFISQEKLNTAMLAASRQGIDTSIKGLQGLSEKYLSLAPGVERAQFLMQTFGRSGADMGKLMELGADGIRIQMDAVEESLIVNQQSVEVVYAYKRALDAATDAQDALKYSIAQGAMPAETRLNEQIASTTIQIEESGAATEALSSLMWMLEGALSGVEVLFGGDSIFNMTKEEYALARATEGTTEAIDEQSGGLDEYNTSIAATSSELSSITSMFKVYTQEMLYNKLAADMDAEAALALSIEMGLLDTTTYSLMLATDELTGKYDINEDGVISLTEMTSEYKAEVMALKNSVDLLQDKTIKITVDTVYNSTSGPNIGDAERAAGRDLNGNGKVGFSNGGSFTVPSWAGYEGFNMGGVATASAGETVTVNKAGSVNNNDVLSATLKALPKMIAREIRQLEKYG